MYFPGVICFKTRAREAHQEKLWYETQDTTTYMFQNYREYKLSFYLFSAEPRLLLWM